MTADVAPPRYALYWVPDAAHALWTAGCAWLKGDPALPRAAAPPYARVASRYGFHATLKAPMALREGATHDELLHDVRRWARQRRAFEMPALEVGTLGDFIALRTAQPIDASHPLRQLADAAVRDFDRWRRASSPDERDARRAVLGSDAMAHLLLERWGYPHVFERWRWHITLADAGSAADRALLEQARRHFRGALRTPVRVDAVAVFIERDRGSCFQLVERVRLGD